MNLPLHSYERLFCSISTLIAVSVYFTPQIAPDLLPKSKEYSNTIQLVDLSTKNLLNNNFDSLTIPLKRAGRLIMIEATVDDEEGNLIFDTGATNLVLNRTYFRNHVVSDDITSKGITGSVGKVEAITVDRLFISDLSFKKVMANLADLGHIENKRGVKILGLFGFNLFRDFEILIDVHNGVLQLHRIDKKGERVHPNAAFKLDYTQKMDVVNNIVLIRGVVGGKSVRFCLDTGAETNAISSDCPNAVLKTITINRKSDLHGAGSVINQVLFGTMNDFVLGDTHLHRMETIITNLDYLNEAYGVHIGGMLGFNFLMKGIICINFEKSQFGICYNKSMDL